MTEGVFVQFSMNQNLDRFQAETQQVPRQEKCQVKLGAYTWIFCFNLKP